MTTTKEAEVSDTTVDAVLRRLPERLEQGQSAMGTGIYVGGKQVYGSPNPLDRQALLLMLFATVKLHKVVDRLIGKEGDRELRAEADEALAKLDEAIGMLGG